ncbi:Leo1-domain-containing protein [Calocera viscosa TUFC12733]|uniref:Leo1-domain-containing protein n=1 Tax=Calocera viscosa (strain TUFC12733) TaxID=1330018 RepID=A0A167SFN5_CALVF|nr:Leo1-domain-containing protein [Calocera viscosa TUFC12733]
MGADLPKEEDEERDVTALAPAPAEDEDDDDDDLFGDAEQAEEEAVERATVPNGEYRDVDEQEGRALGSGDEGRDMDGLSSPERRKRKELEYGELSGEEGEQEDVSMTTAEVYAPKLPVPESSDGKFWMLHLPNYVAVDPKPFDPLTYVGPEMTDREVLDAPTAEAKAQKVQEMSHFIQYQVKNALRWRWVKGEDGQMRKESNARVVKWSDGTMSFQVGTEFWDVTQMVEDAPTSRDTSFAVVQMEAPGILQAVRSLTGSMALRPTGLNSRTHRDLVRAIGQKHSKIAKLRMTGDGDRAPEAVLREILKEDNRAAAKRRTKERAADGFGTPRKRRGAARRGREEMWSDEEEYQEDEDEDEEGSGRRGRGSPRKGGVPREGRRAGSYEEDDFLVKDTDDEEFGEEMDGEASPRRARKRPRPAREEEEEEGKDDMELAEDKLEEAARVRKRARAAKKEDLPGKKEEEEELQKVLDEPESEEEEDPEEVGVRRVGAGAGAGGRRRVVVEEDEE